MEINNKRRIWFGIFVVLTILLIYISIGMMKFTFEVSSGYRYMNLIETGVDRAFAIQDSGRAGHLAQFLYFFAFPFPIYLLTNLLSAHFLTIRVKSKPVPLWRITFIVFGAGVTFLTLSFSVWQKDRTIVDIAMGSFGIWLLIFAIFAVIVAVGELLRWIWRRYHSSSGGSVTQGNTPQ